MKPSPRQSVTLASERIDRVLYFSLGFGGLIFLVLALAPAGAQFPLQNEIEGVALLVLLAALCAAFLAVTAFASLRMLRVIASVYIVVFTVALALWCPLLNADRLPRMSAPWPLSMIAVATSCAAIAWPRRWAWAYLFVACTGGGIVRYYSDVRVAPLLAVEDFFYMLLISTVFAALIQVTRDAGRQQDAATASAHSKAAKAAETRARGEQRARFGALVHDDVISTLLVAAHADGSMREDTRAYARRALTRIGQARAPHRSRGTVSAAECEAQLRAASDVPGAPSATVTTSTSLRVPSAAVQALGEALGEALRNSIRHAGSEGRPVQRRVTAAIDDDGVRVSVHDDGVGFSPQRIPPERLGLRVSVIGRMLRVPGGAAEVISRPGGGTRVNLAWSRAAAGRDR